MSELKDMEIAQQHDYRLEDYIMAPDGIIRKVIYKYGKEEKDERFEKMFSSDSILTQEEREKNGYEYGLIHNKRYLTTLFSDKFEEGMLDDDSYYAPDLISKVGKKTGISVPETEIRLVLHGDYQKRVNETLFESSIVYYPSLKYFYDKYEKVLGSHSILTGDQIQSIYHEEKSKFDENNNQVVPVQNSTPTIDDFVNANLHYLTTRGNKPQGEYFKSEIDEMKQDLIDRLMLGLRMDCKGETNIFLYRNKQAILEPYYPVTRETFFLSRKNSDVKEILGKSDEEFKHMIDEKKYSQYSVKQSERSSREEALRYIFEKYPSQAEKSYEKLSRFTKKDFSKMLEGCTRMSEEHKEVATRTFNVIGREFDEIYQEHMKMKKLEDK